MRLKHLILIVPWVYGVGCDACAEKPPLRIREYCAKVCGCIGCDMDRCIEVETDIRGKGAERSSECWDAVVAMTDCEIEHNTCSGGIYNGPCLGNKDLYEAAVKCMRSHKDNELYAVPPPTKRKYVRTHTYCARLCDCTGCDREKCLRIEDAIRQPAARKSLECKIAVNEMTDCEIEKGECSNGVYTAPCNEFAEAAAKCMLPPTNEGPNPAPTSAPVP